MQNHRTRACDAHHFTFRILPFALSVLLVLGTGCASGANAILEDEWATISMGGTRIGYIHTVTRRVNDPDPAIVTSVFSETRLRRLGIELAVRNFTEYRETTDGALLSASTRTDSSGTQVVTNAEVRGDRMVITTRTFDTTHTKELPWKGEVIGPHAQTRLIREAILKPGFSFEFKAFVPELQRIARSTLTIERRETLKIEGESLNLWRGTLVQDILPGLLTQVWLDDDGNVARSLTDVMGGIETLRVSREEALQAIAPEELADIMIRFFIKSNVTIRNSSRVKEALFRIEGPARLLDGLKLEDRRQVIERRTPKAIFLRVRALGDASTLTAEKPGPEFLAPAPYVQSDDPEIIRLAQKAMADAATPHEKAKRLERWVFDNITEKDLSVGFASAKEVALSRKGDCTEHAVLLAALLRAAGIPSRVAVGLVYWRGMFGYHMWTEAFLNDWTALDATLTEDVVDATHIKFADTPLDSASAADPFISLVQVVGKIELTVEEVKK